MKFLRNVLWSMAASATLFAAACTSEPGSGSENITDSISDSVMEKAPVAPGEFAITRSPAGEWFFNAVGLKGEIVLLSEAYQSKSAAINGVLSVEENGVRAESYEILETTDGFVFVLRAKNNQVIADSIEYRTLEEAQAGIVEARDLVAGILQYKAAVTDGARFDLWRDTADKRWYFQLKTEDGRVLVASQSYQQRTGAVTGLESVRLNGKDLTRFSVVDKNGETFFVLKAGNGKEIGSGGPFESADVAQAAVQETNTLLLSERVASPW